jgi:putative transposase
VSKHTIYAWKARFGGVKVNDAQPLRSLGYENSWPKRLVTDLSRDAEGGDRKKGLSS